MKIESSTFNLRDSDYGYDLAQAMQSKRRCLSSSLKNRRKCPCCNSTVTPSSCNGASSKVMAVCSSCEEKRISMVEDEEYMKFLEILVKEEEKLEEDERLEDDRDPGYLFFLEHLREDGKSYVFEVKGGALPVYVKYELDGHDATSNEFFDDKPKCPCPKSSDSKEVPPFVENRKRKMDESKDVPPFLENRKHKVDETYLAFLKHIKIEGDTWVMESDEGIIKYDQENEIPIDGGVPLKGGTPYRNELKIKQRSYKKSRDSCADEDDRDSVQSLTCLNCPSEFEEKLREVLNKEYSEQELIEKYKEATHEKPLERYRVLRGRSITYPTEQTSRSYLDYHPDLAKMVRKAMNESNAVRALSLLRSLFFYLKNVSHEGAFLPWRNSSILKLIQALGNQL